MSNLLFTIVPIFMAVVFAIVIFSVVKGLIQNAKNAAAPMEQRMARVVAKRTRVWGSENSYTAYYVTFEMEGGFRVEFEVKGAQSGQLVEGDEGVLFTQGTAFRSFNRQVA